MEMTLPRGGWESNGKADPLRGMTSQKSNGNYNSRFLRDDNKKGNDQGNSGVYAWSKKGDDSGKGARENCPCYKKRVRSSMSATFQWLPAVGPA